MLFFGLLVRCRQACCSWARDGVTDHRVDKDDSPEIAYYTEQLQELRRSTPYLFIIWGLWPRISLSFVSSWHFTFWEEMKVGASFYRPVWHHWHDWGSCIPIDLAVKYFKCLRCFSRFYVTKVWIGSVSHYKPLVLPGCPRSSVKKWSLSWARCS